MFKRFIEKKKHRLFSIVTVSLICLVLVGCQGLINANGADNHIVLAKQEVNVG